MSKLAHSDDKTMAELEIKRCIEAGESPSPAIWLRRDGEHVAVLIDVCGIWIEVIRERADGAFSHIVEPSGILAAMAWPRP
jgi:hypothetical protein